MYKKNANFLSVLTPYFKYIGWEWRLQLLALIVSCISNSGCARFASINQDADRQGTSRAQWRVTDLDRARHVRSNGHTVGVIRNLELIEVPISAGTSC